MNLRHLLARGALLSLLFALPLAGLSGARAESSFQAVVTADSMNVYDRQAPHPLLGTLPKGTVVTVTAYSGSAAAISYGGRTGVARISDMGPVQNAASESACGRTMYANRDTRVYSRASTASAYTAIGAGTSVELLAVKGDCAKVSYGGKAGYMVYSHLGDSAATADAAAETAEAVQSVNMAVVTSQAAPVYADANRYGPSVTVQAGTKLTLLAVRGDWAMVERDGAIGYTALGNLSRQTAEARQSKAKSDANPFGFGSNEYTIYAFLTGELGYNRAAAMGVMANIKYESGYRPVVNGDGGTSYGICQWHAGRKTNLINYCAENSLDYTALEGQLQFLKYELTTRYPSVHSYLKQVENTADGAYDAGYYFCFNFEAPAARTSQSTSRGNYAKDALYEL